MGNLQTHFSSYSTKKLKKRRNMLLLLNHPMMGLIHPFSFLLPYFLQMSWIKKIIKKTIFLHFCGGETFLETQKCIEKLYEKNIYSTIDYSVESKQNEKDYQETKNILLDSLEKSKGDTHIPFCVLKITGITQFDGLAKKHAGEKCNQEENEELEKMKVRFETITQKAKATKIKLLVDAEESWIQKPIHSIVREMMQKYNRETAVIYNTYQMYLKNKFDELKKDFEKARAGNYFLGVKLVRGAYMEKERKRAKKYGYPSPIEDNKQSCDNSFNQALVFCIKNNPYIHLYLGTHNEESIDLAMELIEQYQLNKKDPSLFFSQLLGMSDYLTLGLSSKGYNTTKYIPFGKVEEVIPYLMRRIRENSSIKGQSGNELVMIKKELERRKTKPTF